MKTRLSILILIASLGFFSLFSCKTENSSTTKQTEDSNIDSEIILKEENGSSVNDTADTIKVATEFSNLGFDDKIYYELLIETRLCNPEYDSSADDGSTPCSARYFQFFPYNHKRRIEDAFLLQVKAGVNKYPYRRLLIFVREKGELILMNGIVGYIVERIPQPNQIDDLIVAIIDDLGNDQFDRYDVLLKYSEGKYHFIEAVGDLQGEFNTPDLKKRATKAIHERIIEKDLIY